MRSIFNSLKVKINFFILSLIVISFMVFSITFIASEKKSLSEEIVKNGQVFAAFSTQAIYDNFVTYYTHNTEEDFINFKKNIEVILANNKDVINVKLVGVNGRILFDSSEFKDGKYEGRSRSILDQETLAMINKDTVSYKRIIMNGQTVTEIVNPLNQGGSHIFSVTYTLSHSSLSNRMRQVYTQILLVVIPLLILISIFTFLFVRLITKPINVLSNALIKIREGDWNSKVEINTNDEIGQLGVSFNEMASKLKESYTVLESKIKDRTTELEEERGSLEKKVSERTTELEELKNDLEKMVGERTHNLNDKLLELEKINELMVDRELKMIDLKNENEELKKKLGISVN